MTKSNLSKEQLDDIAESFAIFDKNGDGKISPSELFMVMLTTENCPSEDDVKKMIAVMDKDGDGNVSFEEYVESMKK